MLARAARALQPSKTPRANPKGWFSLPEAPVEGPQARRFTGPQPQQPHQQINGVPSPLPIELGQQLGIKGWRRQGTERQGGQQSERVLLHPPLAAGLPIERADQTEAPLGCAEAGRGKQVVAPPPGGPFTYRRRQRHFAETEQPLQFPLPGPATAGGAAALLLPLGHPARHGAGPALGGGRWILQTRQFQLRTESLPGQQKALPREHQAAAAKAINEQLGQVCLIGQFGKGQRAPLPLPIAGTVAGHQAHLAAAQGEHATAQGQ